MPAQHIGRGINQAMQASFGMEVFYSFVIILCALLIYFGTRELYKLTSHKGIKYFRLAFLFFAISYFFRALIKFTLLVFDPRQIIHNIPPIFWSLNQMLFMYFSAMAVFYLLYSVLCKKLKSKKESLILLHILAIVIAIVTPIFNNLFFSLIINLILLSFVAIVFIISHRDSKKKKKKSWFYLIYLLLFVFWILNIIDILIPTFLQTFQLIIYLASTTIFVFILYKVLRKTGN
ncbi:hypothetical protein HOD29_07020 [archaeon]|jgi:hypothetical protein|nr:hypothetical protein [archaeon]